MQNSYFECDINVPVLIDVHIKLNKNFNYNYSMISDNETNIGQTLHVYLFFQLSL